MTTTADQEKLGHLTFGLVSIDKKVGQLTKSAKALSWGLLGSTLGYALGSLWVHLDSHAFLSVREVSSLGYVAFAGCHVIATRSRFATNRCLRNAKLLFIAEQVTEKEYNRMRDRCLKKGELI
jgi:hypothetical protein